MMCEQPFDVVAEKEKMTRDTGTASNTQTGGDEQKRLGLFLRHARERLAPANAGRRRRTPGLRREEVADAAGISLVWYTWLEQGRRLTMSRETSRKLAQALHLNEAEARYLQDLSATRPDNANAGTTKALESVVSLVSSLSPHPAYAIDRVWNVASFNKQAEALLGAFVIGDPVKGNVLARLFLDADWKSRFVDWPVVARSAVAQFRAATATFVHAPDVVALVSFLASNASEFDTYWSKAEVELPADWTKGIHAGKGVAQWRHTVIKPSWISGDYAAILYLPA